MNARTNTEAHAAMTAAAEQREKGEAQTRRIAYAITVDEEICRQRGKLITGARWSLGLSALAWLAIGCAVAAACGMGL